MKRTTLRHVISAVSGIMLALGAGQATYGADKTPAMPAKAATAKAPHLELASLTGNLGTIIHGDKASYTFELKNTGTAPLVISKVVPFCGCTVVHFDETVAAGAASKITAEVDTLRLGTGPGSTHVTVESNDPTAPMQRLDLNYEVVDKLLMKPGYGRWKTTQGEKEGTIGNTIWANDGKPFHVVSVDSPYPYLHVTFRPATEAEKEPKVKGDQWRLEMTLASEAPVGALEGAVVVHTDHPEEKLIAVPISGFVRPVMFVFPEVGDFGQLESTRLPVRAWFKVTNFATDKVAITGVEVTGIPGVRTEVQPVTDGYEYKVGVTLPAGMPPGPFTGEIEVRSTSAKEPLIKTPIKGTIAAAQAKQ